MSALIAWAMPYLLAAGAALVTFLGIYAKGRSDAKAKEQAKQAAERLKARDIADQVDSDIGAMTPEQRKEALKEWSR